MVRSRRRVLHAAVRAHLFGPCRALGLAAAVALAPATAYAHGHLTRSEPRAGARLAAAPSQLRLTFSEAPELAVTTVRLLGPAGAAVPLAALALAPDAPRAVVAPIRGPLVPGTYTVAWQMAGADGHPTRGTFTFTVAPPEAPAVGAAPVTTPAPGRGTPGAPGAGVGAVAGEAGATVTAPGQVPPPAGHHDTAGVPAGEAFDAASWPYVGIRWLQYVGLLAVLGAVAFRYAVLGIYHRIPHREESLIAPARRRAARVGFWAALTIGAAAVLRLGAQSYAMHGPAGVLDRGLVGAMVAHTVWGWGWLLQATGVMVAATGFWAAASGRGRGWAAALLGAAALSVTPALSGHAAASAYPALTVVADSVHIAAAGGWLGSLLLVLAAGVPAAMALPADRRGPAVAALVNAFSPTALVCAATAAVTGVLATWVHVGTVPALWGTGYGRTLLLKLGVLSVVAATGLYNWRRVRPALGDGRGLTGAARLRRSATVELGVALVVLLVTAVLVATPTAVDVAATGP